MEETYVLVLTQFTPFFVLHLVRPFLQGLGFAAIASIASKPKMRNRNSISTFLLVEDVSEIDRKS